MDKQKIDRIGLFVIGLALGFSLGVIAAVAQWFPGGGDDDFGLIIATLPPTNLVAFALLLPWIVLLVYVRLREKNK